MSIQKNLIYNISYQFLIMFLPLVTTPYISRVIGADGVGIYSYTYSIVYYFILFAMLGLNNYGNRSIAAVRDNKNNLSKVFSSIYSLQLLTTIIMVIIYLIYVFFFVQGNTIIYYIQLLHLISAMLDINWFYFGLEQFKITVIRNVIIKLLTVLSIFIFVKDSDDLWIYTLIMALGTLISQSMLWFFVKRYIFWIKPNLCEILEHLKSNLVLFIPVLAISIYKIMDKIMLGAIMGTIEVGYYENSEKIVSIPLNIISALGVVMLPRMTNLNSSGNKDKIDQYIEASLRFAMFIAIGSCSGLMGIAFNFIPIFLGQEFIECIPIVATLSITLLFISWANVIRTQYLIPTKKDGIYIKSTLLGALVNVISNLIFIPLYGALGAAIGTIFAEAIVAIYQTYKVKSKINIRKYLMNSLVYVIPAFIMYFVICLLRIKLEDSIFTIIIQIALGGSCYLIFTLVSLFSFDIDTRKKIKKYLIFFTEDIENRFKGENFEK